MEWIKDPFIYCLDNKAKTCLQNTKYQSKITNELYYNKCKKKPNMHAFKIVWSHKL